MIIYGVDHLILTIPLIPLRSYIYHFKISSLTLFSFPIDIHHAFCLHSRVQYTRLQGQGLLRHRYLRQRPIHRRL